MPPVIIDGNPIVESPAGKFKGRVIKSRNGRDIYTFEGIPYAKPPVAELRFKDPVKMGRLEGIFEATDGSSQCYQPVALNNTSVFHGTEDCLYLNVHVPKVNNTDRLPILVWIHGGGFIMGSSSIQFCGPDFLLDNDMILVSLNYRLGILGFLSTGDRVIPGNFGMKDQIMALKWVQENIASFGGDPRAVTVGGQSAGGDAVSLLMRSPLSKGLFQKAIIQSKSSCSSYGVKPWSIAKQDAEKVASHLGYSVESEKLLKYLQKTPIKELFDAANKLNVTKVVTFNFVPVLEDPSPNSFLTKESWNQAASIPLLTGVNSCEAFNFLRQFTDGEPKYKDGGLVAIKEDFSDLIAKWGSFGWIQNKSDITDELNKFYFKDAGIESASEEKMIDLLNDLFFFYPQYLLTKYHKGQSYKYLMSYKGFRNLSIPKQEGVSHGEELFYLFKTAWLPNMKWEDEDLNISNQLVDMWHNFIKSSKPTGDGSWSESEGGTKYLDITNKGLVMKTNMFQQRMQFLDQLNIENKIIGAYDQAKL